ncbi:DUF2059 domain-containing protein [Vibrio sp. RE86]|uniref:DUF2059 domain-containing protein n=1 Tax=Vibrio sp. RE86 TaxID=2607605 RepID=UPI001C0F7129|nr:DUF2059 domain-containing protein [Vibrio sp. RE86]
MLAIIVAVVVAYSPVCIANTKSDSVAKLLEVMKIDDQMKGGFEAMLPTIHQLAARLQLSADETEELKNIYRDWFQNDVDRFYIGSQIADLYSDTFSQSEIEEIIQFYQTPTGRKLVNKSPELTKLGAQIGLEEAQRKQQQLLEKLTPFIEKHQP